MNYKLEEHQIEAVKALEKDNHSGMLHMTMRSGKTLIMLHYLDNNPSYKKILWLAENEREVSTKLGGDIDKFGFDELYKKMDIMLPHSLHKIDLRQYDMIVYNECHTITDKRIEYLSYAYKNTRIIGLTGTYPNKLKKDSLLRTIGLSRIIYEYLIDDASGDEAISDYNITIYTVPLSTQKDMKVEYRRNGKAMSFMTSELDSYNSISNKIANSMSSTDKKRFGIYRMRNLNKANSKIKAVQKYLYNKKDKRYLIFAQDSKQAATITKYTYNSKTNSIFLDMFKKGDINHLALVEKATVGETYTNLDGCVSVNINSSNVNVLQKAGRALLFREGYTADLVFFISEDTIQHQHINKALASVDQSKITWKKWGKI